MKVFLVAVTLVFDPAPGQPPVELDFDEVTTMDECRTRRDAMRARGSAGKQQVWCWTARDLRQVKNRAARAAGTD